MQQIQTTLRRIRLGILVAAALFLSLIGGVLFLVPVDETVRATGTVMAEQDLYLYSPADSTLQEILAADGAAVKAGDVILRLDGDELTSRRDQLQAEAKEADAQVQLKQSALERIAKLPLPKEFWYAQTELAAAEQKAHYTATEHERYHQLFVSKLTSETEVSSRKLADQLAQGDLTNARERVRVVNAGLEQSITKEALADLNATLARVERLKIEQAVCERELARRSLRAPADGMVTLLLKRRTGERIAKGEELVHLSAGSASRANLYVGEPQLHRLHAGQQVRLSTPVFSSLRYGYIEGHVEEVALEPLPRSGDARGSEARYRVKVRIDRTPMPLVLGTSLDAEIVLRRVPIWRLLLPAELERSS